MINDLLKWLFRTIFAAIFWVFVFSITVNGRSIFYYANDLLVQNEFVQTIDEQFTDLWQRLSETARVTFAEKHDEDRVLK